jgi:hypothetical protein
MVALTGLQADPDPEVGDAVAVRVGDAPAGWVAVRVCVAVGCPGNGVHVRDRVTVSWGGFVAVAEAPTV